jgi:hypothetical protein
VVFTPRAVRAKALTQRGSPSHREGLAISLKSSSTVHRANGDREPAGKGATGLVDPTETTRQRSPCEEWFVVAMRSRLLHFTLAFNPEIAPDRPTRPRNGEISDIDTRSIPPGRSFLVRLIEKHSCRYSSERTYRRHVTATLPSFSLRNCFN